MCSACRTWTGCFEEQWPAPHDVTVCFASVCRLRCFAALRASCMLSVCVSVLLAAPAMPCTQWCVCQASCWCCWGMLRVWFPQGTLVGLHLASPRVLVLDVQALTLWRLSHSQCKCSVQIVTQSVRMQPTHPVITAHLIPSQTQPKIARQTNTRRLSLFTPDSSLSVTPQLQSPLCLSLTHTPALPRTTPKAS